MGGGCVKITSVTTRVVNAEMRNWVFVRVETDQSGLYGWGEATLEWKTRAVAGAVEDLAPLLLGRDPRDIEQLVRVMKKQSFWRLGVIGMSAVSGIELALWDILGKSLGVPVWRLLGGKVRDRVQVYTHLGLGDMRAVYETLDAEPLVERAREVADEGYHAFKVGVHPLHATTTARLPEIDQVARMMEALREAVGADIEIMIDFHGRPASVAAALAYIEALAPGRPLFVEEPLPPGDTPRPCAQWPPRPAFPSRPASAWSTASNSTTLFRCARRRHRPARHLPLRRLLEAKKIAAMAEAASIGVAPHNPLGPIAGVAALHFAVSTPNHVIQEEMVGAVPWYFDVVQGPIRMVDGHWQIPELPGLGIEVNEAECVRYPFQQEVIHTVNAVLGDGTIVDW